MDSIIRQDCTALEGHFRRTAFYQCNFKKLNNLTLDQCDLNYSRFLTDDIQDALGFTLTLNCFSFNNVEYSELLFDLLLLLICKTKGNDEKRRKLLDIVGRDRAFELLSIMKSLEE